MKEKKGRERTKGERISDNETRRKETDRRQMSIVKMVVAELKMDVCDLPQTPAPSTGAKCP